jgi:hypothetical protein
MQPNLQREMNPATAVLCATLQAGSLPNILWHSNNFGKLFPNGLSHADGRINVCMPLSATVCATCSTSLYRIVFKVMFYRTRLTHLIPVRTLKLTPADEGPLS